MKLKLIVTLIVSILLFTSCSYYNESELKEIEEEYKQERQENDEKIQAVNGISNNDELDDNIIEMLQGLKLQWVLDKIDIDYAEEIYEERIKDVEEMMKDNVSQKEADESNKFNIIASMMGENAHLEDLYTEYLCYENKVEKFEPIYDKDGNEYSKDWYFKDINSTEKIVTMNSSGVKALYIIRGNGATGVVTVEFNNEEKINSIQVRIVE